MAKNRKNKPDESGQQASKTGKHLSDKKHKPDDKPKKATQQDHLKHIPFRLREIMKSKDRMKSGHLKSKKLKGARNPKSKPRGMSQDGDIPVPHFKRGKKESEKAYLQRMERATNHVLFLTKNQVDRKPELNEDTGISEKKKE